MDSDSDSDSDSASSEEIQILDGDEDDSDSSTFSYYEDDEVVFIRDLPRIRDNNPQVTELYLTGVFNIIETMTNEEWEQLGRYLSNNSHIEQATIEDGSLSDETVHVLFRSLTRSSSIQALSLRNNEMNIAAIRSMVPFLENAACLRQLNIDCNEIKSTGFGILVRALSNSPIEKLSCEDCEIESIEIIDTNFFPPKLKNLNLSKNTFDVEGCQELAKLLQWKESSLVQLDICSCEINDEGVAVLVDALRNNTTLQKIYLVGNDDTISMRGEIMMLKLVNDISSIKATLQSNHTLQHIQIREYHGSSLEYGLDVQDLNDSATETNALMDGEDTLAIGRLKLVETQLHYATRVTFAQLQGVKHSLYSEIKSLHLPEVLSLIGHEYGQNELYMALKLSIEGVMSIVDRKECLRQQRDFYLAKAAEINAELEKIEAAEGSVLKMESRMSKRRKT